MPCPSGAPPPCRAARTTAAAAFILAVWQLPEEIGKAGAAEPGVRLFDGAEEAPTTA